MLEFPQGWDSTAVNIAAQARRTIAARVDQAVAESLCKQAAGLAMNAGNPQMTGFGSAVLSRLMTAKVVKGLHQSEGSVVDSTAHLTVRIGKFCSGSTLDDTDRAYHLYVQMVDPPLGKARYELKPQSLTCKVGNAIVAVDLSGLGVVAAAA